MTSYRVSNTDGIQALDYNALAALLGGSGVISGCIVSDSPSTMAVDISSGTAFIDGTVVGVPAQTVSLDPGNATTHRRDRVGIDVNGDGFVEQGDPYAEFTPDITDAAGDPDLDRLREVYEPAAPAVPTGAPIADVTVPAGTEDIGDRHIRNRQLESILSVYDLSVQQLSVGEADVETFLGLTFLEDLQVEGDTSNYRVNELIGTTAPSASYVILLEEFDSNASEYTRGTFVGKRHSGSTGVSDMASVHTSSSDGGSHRGNVIVRRTTAWSDSFIDLVTCIYNGTEYVALRYDTSDSNISHTDGIYFTGESSSAAAGHLECIEYRTAASGVTNAEINDSLTPAYDRSGFGATDTIDFQTSQLHQNGEAIGASSGGSGGTGGLTYTEGAMTLPSGDHRNLGAPIAVPAGATVETYTVAVDGGANFALEMYNVTSGSVAVSYTSSYSTGAPLDSLAVGGDTIVPRVRYSGSGTADGVSGMVQFDIVEA